MEVLGKTSIWIIVLVCFAGSILQAKAYNYKYCSPRSTCYGIRKVIYCPYQCPDSQPNPNDPEAKICYIDCMESSCSARCFRRKPNCNGPGAACYDPRFIGGDGIVFYFHGKSNEDFSLVSDKNLQINGRFIGHRPAGRGRHYTWIQALGILVNSQKFSVEATKVATWNNHTDHLKFTYNGNDVVLEEGYLSTWYSPEKDIKVERTANKNSVIVSLEDVAEIMINVVPVTKEDDRIHNYQVPKNDCFAHLEAQFKFFALSPKVEGVLGRTYRPDFENPAKPGVAMPVVGGEEKYRTSSLLSADCATCLFSKEINESENETPAILDYGTLDCTSRSSGGYGIACKK